MQGGDRDQIEDADTAIAWVLGQLPAVPMSWPQHMEVQDLYPVATSTYTWSTGTDVKVPCFAQDKVVEIPITECPDSFVNPMDPNNDRACVKVLRGTNYVIFKLVSHFLATNCTCTALPSGSILRQGVYMDVGYQQCCGSVRFAVELFHVHDLVRSHTILFWPLISTFHSFYCLLFYTSGFMIAGG